MSKIIVQLGATDLIVADHQFFKEGRVCGFHTHPILILYQSLYPFEFLTTHRHQCLKLHRTKPTPAKNGPTHLNLVPGRKCTRQKPSLLYKIALMFILRCLTDPLVHHGRHFGRTVHAMCNFPTLLNNGIMRLVDELTPSDASLTPE